MVLMRESYMSNFHDLALKNELVHNLTELGHIRPTPIQSLAIPLILSGSDLLGIAQTGTGKTGAFSLPILQHLLLKPKSLAKGTPRVLILIPTRELCLQVTAVIEAYAKNLPLSACAIFGGVEQTEQVRQLREGVDVVVATPGRLLDLIEQKQIRLSEVEVFVLDEADRMLDMGFIDEIKQISTLLPVARQNMLFSATMPIEIENLAAKVLRDPKKVQVAPAATVADKIQQRFILCSRDNKFQLLKKIIKEEKIERVLVFTKTKTTADYVVEYLAQNRTASKTFHSDMKQPERERALNLFKEGSIKVLVATDMASRGLDIEGISHVINFDLPLNPETYVHRIGRTARSGKDGIAISFCDDSEKGILTKIEQTIQLKIKTETFEGKSERLNLKATGLRKVTAPTPGKSQEKTAYLDHSKRQAPLKEGEKRVHPGFRNNTKKKRK
jgi:ATP-dependent RNA helicase RhlE